MRGQFCGLEIGIVVFMHVFTIGAFLGIMPYKVCSRAKIEGNIKKGILEHRRIPLTCVLFDDARGSLGMVWRETFPNILRRFA